MANLWRVTMVCVLIGAASLAAVALGAPGKGDSGGKGNGGKGKREGEVRVATTGSFSERIERLPITRDDGAKPRVAMSLGPSKLSRLRRGDRLELTAEVQVTLNCNEPEPRCIGAPYDYDPRLAVRLIMTDARGRARGMRLGPAQRTVCRQRRPREHHCVVTITNAATRIDKLKRLPCPAGGCFVNLVLDAHNGSAQAGDELIVGGVKPDGSIPQDRGRINSVLFRPGGARYPGPRRTRSRLRGALPLDLKRHVVYSQPVRRLAAGDQLAVEAAIHTSGAGLPYSVRTSAQLILATGRSEVRPGPLARRVGGMGEISEANGFNCTRNRDSCVSRKVGVLKARRSARVKGRFRRLFVNVVMVAGAKRVDAGGGDRYRVLRKGGLSVTRYAKPRGGGGGKGGNGGKGGGGGGKGGAGGKDGGGGKGKGPKNG